ncbi:MAG: BON domain-containing protein [Hyphomonadaceae bacterium]|nr:BON domain-containing protein [Hyphomonadaceae bacterium]
MDIDIRIRDDVLSELDFEPSIDASGVGVAVKDGVVTLSGHVPSYLQKVTAEQAAKRVRGVKAVALDLEVRLPGMSKRADDEIAARAIDILKWSTNVGDRITIVVEDGRIKLSGNVEFYFQKEEAERVVRRLSGVTGVSNLISVRPRLAPTDVRDRIAKAFQRNAELESASIQVDVRDSSVTLSGQVKAWHERKIAEDAAWAIPGVTAVHDNIVVR